MEKAFVHNRFKELKLQRKYKSARVIAETLKINRHAINRVLGGDISSDRDLIIFKSILEHIGIAEDAFFNRPDSAKSKDQHPATQIESEITVPLLGAIPAGHPVTVEGIADSKNRVSLPPGTKDKSLFALTVQGMSMQPYLESGDLVYLERLGYGIGPKDPENPAPKSYFDRLHGRVVAVVHNGDATLKLLQVQPLGKGSFNLYLMPINPDFDPIYITESCDVLFQGVVVSIVRDSSRALHNHMREFPNAS